MAHYDYINSTDDGLAKVRDGLLNRRRMLSRQRKK
jgi:hypothetical protein